MTARSVALGTLFAVVLLLQSPAPSLQDLKNATYSGFKDVPSPVTLIDGRWDAASARQSITFVGELRATGDLNGDGAGDAVVLLSENTGGSAERVYVAVVTTSNGQLQNLATRSPGPNVRIRRLRIVERTVVVDAVQVGVDDTMCCPSDLVTRTFVLKDTTLDEPEPATHTGRLTAAAAGQTEWVLRRSTSAEPAPSEPRVTLRYHDGQIDGSTGCNRYTARVSGGDQPGAVTVSPPASTKMACTDDGMAVETRFLRLLHGVASFTFVAGQPRPHLPDSMASSARCSSTPPWRLDDKFPDCRVTGNGVRHDLCFGPSLCPQCPHRR